MSLGKIVGLVDPFGVCVHFRPMADRGIRQEVAQEMHRARPPGAVAGHFDQTLRNGPNSWTLA